MIGVVAEAAHRLNQREAAAPPRLALYSAEQLAAEPLLQRELSMRQRRQSRQC